jgi:hypothetical protein
MSLLDNLPHLATAKRRTRTKDSMGGHLDSFAIIIFSDRACWQQALKDDEISDWQQRNMEVTHKVYFASDPLLDVSCVLEIGGDTLDVISAADPDCSAGMGILFRVMTKKVI